ncbi:hypothetical protein SAMN04488570_2307 [Nocardioides scoriae]|uniref:Uncharacterized protein n=1 Tax=Nocardioides scoriae TaxID=642780 RepID=A0A1H1TSJ6_9ACTN|nr:hypothetical protein [Nocardioides scoriae]SDS62559.1 hypothetical protein SAMN04488570_2307 [Nocardioides scoriae]
MIDWLRQRSVLELVFLTLAVLVVLMVVSGLLTRSLYRRGRRAPFVIRRINKLTQTFVDLVKRPITIAVLDEVADVIQTGHYTKNISAALVENHDELIELVGEKVRNDPSSRVVARLPGYDAVVGQVTETTLRVLIEMLGDPRMDELVSDLLRNNLQQIKLAVRERQNERVPSHEPPDPVPESLRHVSPMARRPGGPGTPGGRVSRR